MLRIEGFSGFELIGSGGFADVYKAEDEFGRKVAVKVLKALDERGRRRFERERVAMGRVHNHPNIVIPYTSGYTNDSNPRPYLVMEFLAGGTLQERLDEDGPFPLNEAIELILPIASALRETHRADIIHKDIKPLNILLTSDRVPKLTDFGISSIRDLAETLSMAYSPEYTPPELFHATRDGTDDPRDERSDLYSLAGCLFTLIEGHDPFYNRHNLSPAGYMHRIVNDPLPTTNHTRADRFMTTAMAKNPEDRYQTATEFIDALQRVEHHVGSAHTVEAPGPPASRPTTKLSRSQLTRTGAVTYKGHANIVWAVTELANGQIASASNDDTVQIWHPVNPDTTLATYTSHAGPVLAVVQLANGQIASASNDNTVHIWDPIRPDTTLTIYTGHLSWVNAVVQLANGMVASASLDNTVQIWDPTRPDATLATYTGHTNGVWDMVELANGTIVSASSDGTVHIWDPRWPKTTLVAYEAHTNWVWAVAHLANGNIASASSDNTVHIWDPNNPSTTLATYEGHTSWVEAVAELANGLIASASDDGTVQIWDPARPGTTLVTYTGHTSGVEAVAELANGLIVSASSDNTVQIWDPDDWS